MTVRPRAVFLSAVGGGPIDRTIAAIRQQGTVDVEAFNAFSTVGWREHREAGGFRSLLARLVVLIAYPIGALFWSRRADILIATTNPFWLPNLLLAARRFHGAKVVTLVYDAYPDSFGGDSRRLRTFRRLMHNLNSHWMHSSSAVIFISSSMKRELENRYGRPAVSTVLVTGTDVSEFHGLPKQADLDAWVGGRILVSYVGNAGHVHDLVTVVEALQALGEVEEEAALLISASGARAEELRRGVEKLPNTRFEPPLDDDRWRWVQWRTDIAIVSLSAQAATASMPSKFFSALGAGCAILCVAPAGSDLQELTDSFGVGIAVEPGQGQEAATSLAALVKDRAQLAAHKRNSAETARRNFDAPALGVEWSRLLTNLG